MRSAILAMAVLVGASHHVHHRVHASPENTGPAAPIFRIDSLMATEQKGRLFVEAKGAVSGGGWEHPALKFAKSANPADAHVLVLDFVAEPPESDTAVIPGLLPVSAKLSVRARRGLVSVRVVSGSNDITSQILKGER